MNITIDYVNKHPELWKVIFYPHKHHGWLGDFHSAAMRNEYPFFMWNDVVYSTLYCAPISTEFPLRIYLN